MEQRINPYESAPGAAKALMGMASYTYKCSIERSLLDLVDFRVSQINGCAYCLDMHSKDLRAHGESEQRLHMIAAWREASVYTERERAALAWAEAVTRLTNQQVPNSVYEQANAHFSTEELVDLTMGVIAINSFNRMNVAFRVPAGNYTPGQHAPALK